MGKHLGEIKTRCSLILTKNVLNYVLLIFLLRITFTIAGCGQIYKPAKGGGTCGCNAGYYCSYNQEKYWSQGECYPCPAGSYCPGGSGNCVSNKDPTSIVPCPPGRYNGKSKGTKESSCTQCSAGKYSSGAGAATSATCTKCPEGTYSTAEGASSLNSCSKCATGKYSTAIGATSTSTCKGCAKGKYSPMNGAGSESSCIQCPAGTYSTAEGASSVNTCSKCATGKYSTALGATSEDTCTKCKAGTYNSMTGSPSDKSCLQCGPGRYSTKDGATSSVDCVSCASGKFSDKWGSTSDSNCGDCEVGSWSSAGDPKCHKCEAGKYIGFIGSAMCSFCSPGRYESNEGSSNCTGVCPVGKFSPNFGGTSADTCSNCPVGTYSYTEAMGTCSFCTPGSYAPEGSVTCKLCPLNFFSNTTGASACTPCPGSLAALTEGSTGCVKLTPCFRGQYSETGYGPDCISCPAGRYSSVAQLAAPVGEGCTPAPYGSYTIGSGNPDPIYCEPNEYTHNTSSTSPTDCISCQKDYIPTEAKDGCIKCKVGYYSSLGQCLEVPSTSSENTVAGIFANKGTPFYALVILVLVVNSLTVVIYFTKSNKGDRLLQFTLLQHMSSVTMNVAGFAAEIVLVVGTFTSVMSEKLRIYSILMVLARTVVTLWPGLWILRGSLCSGNTPVYDEDTGKKTIKYYMDVDIVSQNSQAYSMMLILSLFEPTLLQFMPWYATEFSILSNYPTLLLMRLVHTHKIAQLMVTLTAQVGILITQEDYLSESFGIIVILNVAFTTLSAGFKIFEMFLKVGIMTGTSKSDDCPAAQEAAKVSRYNAKAVGDSDINTNDVVTVAPRNTTTFAIEEEVGERESISASDVEQGSRSSVVELCHMKYLNADPEEHITENPLHSRISSTKREHASTAPNTSVTATETDDLLVAMEKRIQGIEADRAKMSRENKAIMEENSLIKRKLRDLDWKITTL